MERHFREFTSTQTSPGLVLIPQKRVSIGQANEGLVLLWDVVEAAELENRICLIPSMVILLNKAGAVTSHHRSAIEVALPLGGADSNWWTW